MKNKFLVFSLFVLLPLAVRAQLSFTTNNGTLTVTGYNTAAGLSVVIPASTNGYPVTSIGHYSFTSSGLRSVIIPDSVTYIGEGAFYKCSSLTNVMIGGGVTNIGDYLFYECYGLTNVTIPGNVTTLGAYAFSGCSNLARLVIPGGVTSIGYYTFSSSGLTSATIPDSVTNMAEYVFYECSNLTNAVIGGGLASIADYDFSYCTNLASVTIPDNVTNIGNYVFQYCGKLGNILFGSGVVNISSSALYGCSGLTNITVDAGNRSYSSAGGVLFDKPFSTLLMCPQGLAGKYAIPNGIGAIGDSAFYECYNLTNVVIPNSVTNIGNQAFFQCYKMTSITIGSGVTNIGSQAFFFCSGLKSFFFLGNAPTFPIPNQWLISGSPTIYYSPQATGWGTSGMVAGTPAFAYNPQAVNFRKSNNLFGFTVTGVSNTPVEVEAATSLNGPWTGVQSFTLTNGAVNFLDAQSGACTNRFYRFRSP